MKAYGGMEIQLFQFLTFALGGGMGLSSCLGCFNIGERDPSTH